MSEPIKDKAYVEAHPDDFREAYARAREHFSNFPGVAGVAFGQKRVGTEYQDNVAIVIYVIEKKDEAEIPPDQVIPPSFEGYPTDVRVVRKGIAEVCDNQTEYDKIKGGIQIMVEIENGYAQGTLGCLVKKRGDRGRDNVYLLTNKHVLYSPGKGAGADVRHPTESDTLIGSVQEGGLYENVRYPATDPAAPQYFVDAAIARIDLDSTCCGSTCSKDQVKVDETLIVDLQVNGVNSIADVRDITNDPLIVGKKVFKVGRTTGKTTGIVRLVNAPLTADPPPDQQGGANVAAQNTIYVEFDVASAPGGKNCHGNTRFTEEGDSGSVYIDEQNRIIGLHTHRGVPVVSALIPSHGCHIIPVLDSLGICVPVTTGTSHGSSLAIDGSGLEPLHPLGPGDFPLPDGQIGFASQQITTPSPEFLDRPPVSDEEEDHMRELLDAFRQTAKGRELHRVFGDVRREIGYLIRNCRPVKVTWHRNQGPAFLTHVLNHIKGHTDYIPHEVRGISRETLVAKMSEVLRVHGGNSVRRALDQYSEEIIGVAVTLNSAQECIAYLEEISTGSESDRVGANS